jgi:hypothetical protein
MGTIVPKIYMSKVRIDFRDLEPLSSGICFEKIEDVLYVGRALIREIAKDHQRWADKYAAKAEGLEKFLKAVTDKESFKRFAKRYADPESEKKMRKLDDKATTCNRCGLCRYIDLDPHWQRREGRILICRMRNETLQTDFFTPCFLKDIKPSSFRTFIGKVAERFENSMKYKRQALERKNILLYLAELAEEKPILPEWRPDNWFKAGDEVVILEGGVFKNSTVGEIRNGWVYVNDGESQSSYGYKSRKIMLKWELDYLSKDREFMEWYLLHEDRVYSREFTEALKRWPKKRWWHR